MDGHNTPFLTFTTGAITKNDKGVCGFGYQYALFIGLKFRIFRSTWLWFQALKKHPSNQGPPQKLKIVERGVRIH